MQRRAVGFRRCLGDLNTLEQEGPRARREQLPTIFPTAAAPFAGAGTVGISAPVFTFRQRLDILACGREIRQRSLCDLAGRPPKLIGAQRLHQPTAFNAGF